MTDNITNSKAVNESYGVNWSYGVNGSDGVNWGFGIFNSSGVDHAIFLADKPRTYSIFGKEVSEERFFRVWGALMEKLDVWFPQFKSYEAWKDMPQEAIDYIASLPEFDAVMFKRITGINIKTHTDQNKKKALLDKAQELIDKAIELMKEAGRL